MRLIKSKTLVAEIMSRWPETVSVFLKHGAYCIGCDMASFETLEEMTAIYDLPLKAFGEELEQAIARAKKGREENKPGS